MQRPWPAAIVCVLAAVAPGCTISSVIGGEISCDRDAACPPANLCVDGRCVPDIGEGEGEAGEGEGEAGEGEGEAGEGEGEGETGEGVCGDGVKGAGEACDDANDSDDDSCTTRCTVPVCGDGLVQTQTEACDDGNDINSDTCSNACQLAGFCGNGQIDDGETCDDGARGVIDDCTDLCQPNTCGNGAREADERCDDGNRVSLDGCSATCSEVAWRTDVGSGIPSGAGPVLFAVSGVSLVVVGTSDGEVVGLLAGSGQPLRTPVGGPVSSVVATETMVVAATAAGDVVGVALRTGLPAVVWRRDGVAVAGGRARLAAVEDRVFFVTPEGGVAGLDGQGEDAVVTTSNGARYVRLGTPPAPLTTALCDPCTPVLVSSTSDTSPPGSVIVPMGDGLSVWNIEADCAPARLGFGSDSNSNEVARGRPVVSQERAVVVTSLGALLRLDGGGSCSAPQTGSRRLDGTFRAEPLATTTSTANPTPTYVVVDAGRVRKLRIDGTAAIVESTGFPAALPAGRVVQVPAALDDDGEIVVVDETGEVHVFGVSGARRSLGTVGTAPAGGPLLVGVSQGQALVVVATRDGQVVAVEGGDLPATAGWHREAGDQRGSAHATCGQGAVPALLPMLPALLLWRRRRGRGRG